MSTLVALLPTGASRCFDDGSTVTVDLDTEPLIFERVARGQRAAFADTVEVVAQDTQAWTALKRSLQPTQEESSVDFDQMMVLLAAVPSPGGGYHVQFLSVEIFDDEVRAHYALGVPAEDCITTMGLTVPFEAVAVRRVDLPVVFERRQEPIRCTFR